MTVYMCFVYFLRDILLWPLQILDCCKYSKKKRKYITNEQIRDRALMLLNEWKVETSANNKFLYKIPEEREQYILYLNEVSNDY